MSNRRRVVGIIAAFALAVIGTLALVTYVNSAEDRALAGEKVVDVYVATQSVDAGTPATELAGKVKRERVPVKVQADGAISQLSQLDGTVSATDLVPGEQLVKTRFAKPGESTIQRIGNAKIPTGWFQSTILLEPDQALGGTVKAGQRVAVVATLNGVGANTQTTGNVIVRNALVTNVQIDGSKGDSPNRKEVTNAPTGKFLVTLAMPQPELERMVFADDQGKVWLATEPGTR